MVQPQCRKCNKFEPIRASANKKYVIKGEVVNDFPLCRPCYHKQKKIVANIASSACVLPEESTFELPSSSTHVVALTTVSDNGDAGGVILRAGHVGGGGARPISGVEVLPSVESESLLAALEECDSGLLMALLIKRNETSPPVVFPVPVNDPGGLLLRMYPEDARFKKAEGLSMVQCKTESCDIPIIKGKSNSAQRYCHACSTLEKKRKGNTGPRCLQRPINCPPQVAG